MRVSFREAGMKSNYTNSEQKSKLSDSKLVPIFAGISTAIIWGFSFLFTKDALNYTFPSQLLGLRFATGAMVLTILWFLKIIKLNIRDKRWPSLILLSLFQPGLYFIGETWGVKWTSASEAGMIIGLVPVAVALMASVFLKEKMPLLQIISILSSVIGVFIIVSAQGELRLGEHLWGTLALLLAVVSAGVYNMLSKKSSTWFTPVEITFVMMWSGTIIFNFLGLGQSFVQGTFSGYLAPLSLSSVRIAVIYLGALSSVLAFFLFNYAISRLKVSQTAPLTNVTTVTSVLAGVGFQGDSFSLLQFIGVLLILAGVWGTNVFIRR